MTAFPVHTAPAPSQQENAIIYDRTWFGQQDIDFHTDRHLRKADRDRLLTLARNGRPDMWTSVLWSAREYLGNRLTTLGSHLQQPRVQAPSLPLYPRRPPVD